MTPEAREALAVLVRGALAAHGTRRVARAIRDAHEGRAFHTGQRVVTRDNLYLFRLYRNTISGDALVMIEEARTGKLAPTFAERDAREARYAEPDQRDHSGEGAP